MKLKNKKNMILAISIIAILGFIAIFFVDVVGINKFIQPPPFNNSEKDNITNQTRFPNFPEYRTIPTDRLFLSPILLTIGIISISYFITSRRIEKKLENNMQLISKMVNKNHIPSIKNKINKSLNKNDIILRFLNHGERKVLESLIDKNGTILQSDINRIPGMSKLKTHRAVKNLEMRGIIKTVTYGKTKRITLSNDIKAAILNN